MEKQRTISKSVSFTGTGLHTGKDSTITFNPAEANTGYVFIRKDLPGQPEIQAIVDNVVDISRGTTIANGDVKVLTVEHVLAALAGLKIDNCRIELSESEPPVLDGSSMPYVDALLTAGITELDAEREYFVIDESISYSNEDKGVEIVALPLDDFRVTIMIDYFNPALGSQHTGLFDLEKEFVKEFAPARTFCFLTEVEQLRKSDLIKGGKLDNALVIVDKDITENEVGWMMDTFNLQEAPTVGNNGYLNNTELRYKNEPARHKLLDMLGDMALIGIPVKAQILAARPGHESNIEFSKLVRRAYLEQKRDNRLKPWKNKGILWDINALMEFLPHRYPFLLVDRVMEYDREKKVILGYKNVTFNEPFFQGHFPGQPIMPGVLILEACAQMAGLIMLNEIDEPDKYLGLFSTIKNAKLRKPVVPGDQLVIEARMSGKRFNIYSFTATAYVNGQVVAESDFTAALVNREL